MHLAYHYYHVFNRGCNREKIFTVESNYLFLIKRMKSLVPDYSLKVIAYCLMPNHYHFLLYPQEDGIISRFIQRLFNSYTQAYNRQQKRSGTLFEGRAKSVLVDTDEYILHLCRYIHLNPVIAKLVSHPSDWPYSNFPEWIKEREGTLIDHEFVNRFFPTPKDYENFVLTEIDHSLDHRLQKYCLDS
jgi:REP element-mobilizing transposase RayT